MASTVESLQNIQYVTRKNNNESEKDRTHSLLIANPDHSASIAAIIISWTGYSTDISFVPKMEDPYARNQMSALPAKLRQLGFKCTSSGGMWDEHIAFLAQHMGRKVPREISKPSFTDVEAAQQALAEGLKNISDAGKGKIVPGSFEDSDTPERCAGSAAGWYRGYLRENGWGSLEEFTQQIMNSAAISRNNPALRAQIATAVEKTVKQIEQGEELNLQVLDNSLVPVRQNLR